MLDVPTKPPPLEWPLAVLLLCVRFASYGFPFVVAKAPVAACSMR